MAVTSLYPLRARRVNVPSKRRRSPKAPEEPKIKKKPGPKPGWKNKFKPKGYRQIFDTPQIKMRVVSCYNVVQHICVLKNGCVLIVREELPNIYKCPYQGCTAVYRAPDGLKVRIHTQRTAN